MARNVDVAINPIKVRKALVGQNGLITNFHRKVGHSIAYEARLTAPVNKVENQLHRQFGGAAGPKAPGTYRKSFRWRTTTGTNGVQAQLRIQNIADHAIFVEYGRSMSRKGQTFTWDAAPFLDRYTASGDGWRRFLVSVGRGGMLDKTGRREGKRILSKAVRNTLARWQLKYPTMFPR